jgi:hypothetical protein
VSAAYNVIRSADADGNIYVPEVKEDQTVSYAYSYKSGDSYVMTITLTAGGTKKSIGTITVSGNTLKLTASKGGTATVAVSTAGITSIAIDTKITFEDNSTQDPQTITVTPGTKPTVTPGTEKEVIVESTNGQLTITGLSSYNGKYVYASNFEWFFGVINISQDEEFTLGKIENGSVTLKVWKKIESGNSTRFSNYNGTETGAKIVVKLFDKNIITYADEPKALKTSSLTVTFTNGKGTLDASAAWN